MVEHRMILNEESWKRLNAEDRDWIIYNTMIDMDTRLKQAENTSSEIADLPCIKVEQGKKVAEEVLTEKKKCKLRLDKNKALLTAVILIIIERIASRFF